jgi:hypothetical protein
MFDLPTYNNVAALHCSTDLPKNCLKIYWRTGFWQTLLRLRAIQASYLAYLPGKITFVIRLLRPSEQTSSIENLEQNAVNFPDYDDSG